MGTKNKGGKKNSPFALSGLSVQFSRLIEANRQFIADLRNLKRSANYTIGRRLIAAEHTICLILCSLLLRLDALDIFRRLELNHYLGIIALTP